MNIETSLNRIEALAQSSKYENDNFIEQLRNIDTGELDKLVFDLNEKVTPQVDCLQCGNCCKSLMINVEEKEATNVADKLQMTRLQFNEDFLEISESGKMLINTIPCKFLHTDNACRIYEYRFEGCREFPALHLPHIQKRLFTIFMHYDRCPIIFNVIEHLKNEVDFEQ